MGAYGFEQLEGADDVGLDEFAGAVDRAVDVRFGGEIDDGARLVLGEQAADKVKVADVALDEGVARVTVQANEVLAVAGVGELVEGDDGLVGLSQPVEDEIAADETGAASACLASSSPCTSRTCRGGVRMRPMKFSRSFWSAWAE